MKELILRLSGAITIGDGDIRLHNKIREALQAGYQLIILDFAGVTYMDSSAIGELAGALSTVKKAESQLVLTTLQPRVKKIMGTMCFLDIFQVFDTTEDALQIMHRRMEG